MPPSDSTGLFLAFGAAAGVAAASLLAPAGSRDCADSCSSCGRPVGRSGAAGVGRGMGRGSLAKKEEDVRGTFLLRQRYTARAGFVLPVTEIDALNAGYDAFRRGVLAEVREALVGTSFRVPRASRKSLKSRSSRKSLKSRKGSRAVLPFTIEYSADFLEMEAAQRAILNRNGFGPRRGSIEKSEQLELLSIMEYVSEKVHDWRLRKLRRDREAAKAGRAPGAGQGPRSMEEAVFHYAASLYASRAWTLHVCERTGHLAARERLAAYALPGTGNATLFGGVRFELVLPDAPRIPAPRGVKAPLALSGVRRTKADRVVEELAAETAEMLDEAGEEDDAQLLKGMNGMPYLRMLDGAGRAVGFYFVADIGSMYFVRGQQVIPLLTMTSKMASPSFGLPAGLGNLGGTCPGAGVRGDEGLEKNRICSICYATSANYGYANNLTQQLARQLWVSQVLSEEGSAALGYDLACMVEAYARHCRHTDRSGQEIGVWGGARGGLLVPSGRGMRRAKCTWLQIATLDGKSVPENTSRFFAGKRVPEGEVAGFFRVHDSGDFGVKLEGGVMGRDAYVEAWRIAAEMLPSVYFWAPSRTWPQRKTNLSAENKVWIAAGQGAARAAARGQALSTTTTRAFRPDGDAGDCALGSVNRGSRSVVESTGDGFMGVSVDPGVNTVACSPDEALLENREADEVKRAYLVPASTAVMALASLGALPNFTVRPSGVYMKRSEEDPVVVPTIRVIRVGESPVTLVGSGVASQLPGGGHHYPLMVDTRGVEAWQCPVYTVQADGKEAKSCRAANCRACWIAKDLPIFYGAH